MQALSEFMTRGGPALWVIGALSVVTVALILWKLWHLLRLGAWRRGPAERAASAAQAGDMTGAAQVLGQRRDVRSQVARTALSARALPDREARREEVMRVARAALADVQTGNRALDLISTIAPLVGLLGTVLGMIEAFQALQETGAAADAAALAGGIWEALLTTAAGMAVAIPAAVALSWFEGLADRIAADMEDQSLRILNGPDQP